MDIRPFALLKTAVVDEVTSRMTGALKTWCSDWGLDDLPCDVECVRSWDVPAQHRTVTWRKRAGSAGKCLWFAWQLELARLVQRQMFPSDQRHLMQSQRAPSLATEGAETAVQALLDGIAHAVSVDADWMDVTEPTDAIANAFAVASGALWVSIKIGDQTLSCLMDQGCVQAAFAPLAGKSDERIPPGAWNRALDRIPVVLPIAIGQVEVDVRSLLTLAVGDVIRLNTLVDHPLTVHGPAQEALFDAHLGTLDGKMAIEIVRRSNLHT